MFEGPLFCLPHPQSPQEPATAWTDLEMCSGLKSIVGPFSVPACFPVFSSNAPSSHSVPHATLWVFPEKQLWYIHFWMIFPTLGLAQSRQLINVLQFNSSVTINLKAFNSFESLNPKLISMYCIVTHNGFILALNGIWPKFTVFPKFQANQFDLKILLFYVMMCHGS